MSDPGTATSGVSSADEASTDGRRLMMLSLGALGIVFGDIGTSPLYALRACFFGNALLPVNHENVLGVLSLIFWSLILVISIKYLLFVMRADNRGEGGILSLFALLRPWQQKQGRTGRAILLMALLGAALLYGDGMLTPAISVLSAVEGLGIATPVMEPVVLPLTVLILIGLFAFQKSGTAGVGAVFGPIVVVWFVVIGVLGLRAILDYPAVFGALNPVHAVALFVRNGTVGFLVLGGVFLVVTGGEALYADMGHFSRGSIGLAWFAVVLPGLLLNYFGQGAEILVHPEAVRHPFYYLVPSWGVYPMIGLATVVTIIASQAVISGAFSLTRQAVQLGYAPLVNIIQTSSEERGQIYIPLVNWALLALTVLVVLGFQSSQRLAAAYGMAVSTTMVITTVLAFFLAWRVWNWPGLVAGLVALPLLIMDSAFWGANLMKFLEGGWLPLVIGVAAMFLMVTWFRGRELVRERVRQRSVPLDRILENLATYGLTRVPGVAVFLSGGRNAPGALLHQLKINRVLHETVIFLTVVTDDVPRVPAGERLEAEDLGNGFIRVVAHYGFMQTPNVPVALRFCHERGLIANLDDVESANYFLGHARLIPTPGPGMRLWRKRLYRFMAHNAMNTEAFYQLPPSRAVELGVQIEF
jgi:KUP system potassium uptake protein